MTCLVRRMVCLNLRKSPNAIVIHLLSMRTGGLGLMDENGPPTLSTKKTVNL